MRLSHAAMYVSDIADMVDFYTEVLGFQVTDRGPTMGKPGSPEMVFLSHVPDEEHHQLALIHARTSPGRSNTINHLSFRVENLPALRDVWDCVRGEQRARNVVTVFGGDQWAVRFLDPEQNGVEIICDSPWRAQQPYWRDMDFSMSDDELVAWSQDQLSGHPYHDRH